MKTEILIHSDPGSDDPLGRCVTGMTAATLTLETSDAVDLDDSDVVSIRNRIAKWQQLFSPDRDRYTLNGYEDLFSGRGDELLVYDNYAEAETRWFGFERYREVWEHGINANFPKIIVYRIEVDRIEVRNEWAWSAFTWWGETEKDGQTLWPAQHATHVWHKIDGDWRIVHEHLTSGVKEKGQESRRPVDVSQRSSSVYQHRRTDTQAE